MFIAHLPAGYLLTRRLLHNVQDHPAYLKFLACGLFASIAPDLDLLYFHLIDARAHPHHSYWTHIPIYWIGLYLLLAYPVYRLFSSSGLRMLSVLLCGGLLHMCLDSFASSIKWLYPFSNTYYGLWRIPSVYDWWVANYLFHWTFALELGLCSLAGLAFWRDRALQQRLRAVPQLARLFSSR